MPDKWQEKDSGLSILISEKTIKSHNIGGKFFKILTEYSISTVKMSKP